MQKYVQYGGHIEIQDGGHQGAFQSWVLIENNATGVLYKCAKFHNFSTKWNIFRLDRWTKRKNIYALYLQDDVLI